MSPSLLVVQTPGLSTARNIALRAVCNFVRITVREAGDEEEWGERGPPALPPYVQKIYMSKRCLEKQFTASLSLCLSQEDNSAEERGLFAVREDRTQGGLLLLKHVSILPKRNRESFDAARSDSPLE